MSQLARARQLLLWNDIYPVVMQYPAKYDLDDFILIARESQVTLGLGPANSLSQPKSTGEFIVPGLLRVKTVIPRLNEGEKLPGTVHEFHLPVQPTRLPEREKKYVLGEEHYERLVRHLRTYYSSSGLKETRQSNIYFRDPTGVLEMTESMVRIRVEEADGDDTRVILTFKGRGKSVGNQTFERDEQEVDISRYSLQSPSFDQLPDSFKLHFREATLWQRLGTEFAAAGVETASNIILNEIARMRNTRITVETESGLILEVDRFRTSRSVRYELEIETLEVEEGFRDEYVRLLFAALNIPDVSGQNYPSKFVIVLMDAELLPPDKHREVQSAIKQVEQQLGIRQGA